MGRFSDRAMVRTYADNNLDLFDWLESTASWEGYRPSADRLDRRARLGRRGPTRSPRWRPRLLAWPLAETARRMGIEILLKHRMTTIHREQPLPGRVTGITAMEMDDPFQPLNRTVNIRARKGIIATGGCADNVQFRTMFTRLTEEYQAENNCGRSATPMARSPPCRSAPRSAPPPAAAPRRTTTRSTTSLRVMPSSSFVSTQAEPKPVAGPCHWAWPHFVAKAAAAREGIAKREKSAWNFRSFTAAGWSITSNLWCATSPPAAASMTPFLACWTFPLSTAARVFSGPMNLWSQAPTARRRWDSSPDATIWPSRPRIARRWRHFTRPVWQMAARTLARPGMRPYHPGYYAAFLLDPDGNNIEAVFHGDANRSAPSVKITF